LFVFVLPAFEKGPACGPHGGAACFSCLVECTHADPNTVEISNGTGPAAVTAAGQVAKEGSDQEGTEVLPLQPSLRESVIKVLFVMFFVLESSLGLCKNDCKSYAKVRQSLLQNFCTIFGDTSEGMQTAQYVAQSAARARQSRTIFALSKGRAPARKYHEK